MDILQFQPVIADVLRKLKVKRQQKDDFTQECYLALLEKKKHLEHGIEIGDGDNYAAVICRSKIKNIWRKEKDTKADGERVRLDSLSEPRIWRKAAKLGAKDLSLEKDITPQQLESGLLSLPFDEYRVIYEIFILGKEKGKVADDIGVDVKTIWNRTQRGIAGLQKYFEVGI